MSEVFTDLSKEALNKVSEDHFFDSLTCFSVSPEVEVYKGEDMIRVVWSPGTPNLLTNTVFSCRLSTDNVDTVIEETHEYFRSRGVAPHWRLCPSDLPSDLGERLLKKGLASKEDWTAMTVDLNKLNHDVSLPDGFVIKRVTDAAMMKEMHPFISQSGAVISLATLMMDLFSAYGFDSDSDLQHYIGVLNGKPVSNASVLYATGVAGVIAVGTLPEARRQGIGSAITLQGLLDARERGYRVGVLQSTDMAVNMYHELGFEACFKIKTYGPDKSKPEIEQA